MSTARERLVNYSDPIYWRKWQAKCAIGHQKPPKAKPQDESSSSSSPPPPPTKRFDRFGGEMAPLVPDPFPVIPGRRGAHTGQIPHIFTRVENRPSPTRDRQNFTRYLSAPSSFGKQGSSTMASSPWSSFSGGAGRASSKGPTGEDNGIGGLGASSFGAQADGSKRSYPSIGFSLADRGRGSLSFSGPGPGAFDVMAGGAACRHAAPSYTIEGRRPAQTSKDPSPGAIYNIPSDFQARGATDGGPTSLPGAYLGPPRRVPDSDDDDDDDDDEEEEEAEAEDGDKGHHHGHGGVAAMKHKHTHNCKGKKRDPHGGRGDQAFEHFGFGCNLEEHILYGHCLDMKCSSRSTWEQTNAVVRAGKKNQAKRKERRRRRRRDGAGGLRGAKASDQLQLGNRGNGGGDDDDAHLGHLPPPDGPDPSYAYGSGGGGRARPGTRGSRPGTRGSRPGTRGSRPGTRGSGATEVSSIPEWASGGGRRPVSRPASRLAMYEPPRLAARRAPVGVEFVGRPPPVESGTAAHYAADRGEAELLGNLLRGKMVWDPVRNKNVRHGIDVDGRDDAHRTAGHIAALRGDVRSLNALIAHGANLDAQDDLGATPLHLAAALGHIHVVERLLEAGADQDIQDNMGRSPVDVVQKDAQRVYQVMRAYAELKDTKAELAVVRASKQASIRRLRSIRRHEERRERGAASRRIRDHDDGVTAKK
eukprot:g576.t1